MRLLRCLMLGVASVVACTPAKQRRALPPSYAPSATLEFRLRAARARVVVDDARPEPEQVSSEVAADHESELDDDVVPSPLEREEFATLLEQRLGKALGAGDEELVFRVKVVEAEASEEDDTTVRATVDVSVEVGGRKLATTRGVSTLVGHVGGMGSATQQRIEGAVADAFERSVLREAFVKTTNAALVADSHPRSVAKVPSTKQTWSIARHEASSDVHLVSAVFDAGNTYSFAARYLHDHFSDGAWVGYGGESRLITTDFDRIDALAGLAVGRAGIGFEQAYSIEIGFGAGGREHVRGVGVAGLYFSFYYLELGFTYQFVVRPTPELGQLTGLHFGLRVNIPVGVHNVRVRCRSPLPCEPMILPGRRAPLDETGAGSVY